MFCSHSVTEIQRNSAINFHHECLRNVHLNEHYSLVEESIAR